jgi:hypothetical protein
MDKEEDRTIQTPLNDLRQRDLEHYNEASTKLYFWKSGIPTAINFYWDYKQMNFLQKIKQAFKK